MDKFLWNAILLYGSSSPSILHVRPKTTDRYQNSKTTNQKYSTRISAQRSFFSVVRRQNLTFFKQSLSRAAILADEELSSYTERSLEVRTGRPLSQYSSEASCVDFDSFELIKYLSYLHRHYYRSFQCYCSQRLFDQKSVQSNKRSKES